MINKAVKWLIGHPTHKETLTVSIDNYNLSVTIYIPKYKKATIDTEEQGGIRNHEILRIENEFKEDVTEYIINVVDNNKLRQEIIEQYELYHD